MSSTIWSKVRPILREIVIVGAAASLVALILTRLRPSQQVATGTPDHRPLVAVGASVPLAKSAFQMHDTNLILVTSPTCHYCQISEPFHRRVAELAARTSTPLYVVVPDTRAARDYLNEARLTHSVAYRNADMGVRVLGTPTLIMVDSLGVARRVWTGKIPRNMEDNVLQTISEHLESKQAPAHRGDKVDAGSVILDPRERDDYARVHLKNAVNIPFVELALRMRYELNNSTATLIDCSNISSDMCDETVTLLRARGFKARPIDQGATFESCRRHRCEGTAVP